MTTEIDILAIARSHMDDALSALLATEAGTEGHIAALMARLEATLAFHRTLRLVTALEAAEAEATLLSYPVRPHGTLDRTGRSQQAA